MAKTIRTYIDDGVTTNYPIDFNLGYLDNRAYVYVYTGSDYTTQLGYTWVDANNISLDTPVLNQEFYIRRVIPRDNIVNDYSDGAIQREKELDQSFLQAIMLFEEVEDGFMAVVPPWVINGSISMNGNDITDVETLITSSIILDGQQLIPSGVSVAESESYVLTSGQITQTFVNSTGTASFYITGPDADNGRLSFVDDYTVNHASKTIMLTQSYPAGTRLTMVYSDGSAVPVVDNFTQVFTTVAALQAASLPAGVSASVQNVGPYVVAASGTGLTLANGNIAVPDTDSVLAYGVTFDGITDDSAAWQTIADVGGTFNAEIEGTTIIDVVSLSKNLTIVCGSNTVFKRKDGADAVSGSYWAAGAAMFELDADGITFAVTGAFQYDGNSANQTTTEPTGFFSKCYPKATPTGADTIIALQRGRFFGGTSGYILNRGDDNQRRYETYVYLDDCSFEDTIYGIGKGDPATPNALGYLPTYVWAMDYVKLHTNNFRAKWTKATGTGQYAACALNGTFATPSYATSGEASVFMHGTTEIDNLGRSAKKYDDADWVTNNGIGAIDLYGNAETLYIENLVSNNAQNVSARAKGSVKHYIVQNATLTDCHRGLQVGPSTTGTPEAVIRVGSVRCSGGTIPQVEFVGDTSTSLIPSVSIGSVYDSGTKTNPEGLVSIGSVQLRNLSTLDAQALKVFSCPLRGINIQDVVRASIGTAVVNATTNGEGVFVSGTINQVCEIGSFDIRNTSGAGVSTSGTVKKLVLSAGYMEAVAGYGLFCNSTTQLVIDGVESSGVSGTSRHIYVGPNVEATITSGKTDATTPIFLAAGGRYNERDNSWNPKEWFGTAAPVSGTFIVGDKILDTTPSAGGTIGWICTTAGTPGTWKTFGTITA